MRIAILNKQGIGSGGATRAARRLLAGLRLRGHEALMISPTPGHDPEGIGLDLMPPQESRDRLASRANRLVQEGYIGPRRTPLSNTLFSPEVAGYRFADGNVLDAFDVINIHWVPDFMAPHSLEDIVGWGKPVVLTLHDMAAFTGGCHYSAGCQGYRASCAPCSQIEHDVLGLASWTLREKRRVLRAANVSAIAPSRWIAACAEASQVFAPGQIHVIPNGLDTDVFRPTATAIAKRAFGIAPEVKTLLFGAETSQEHRKGFDLLLEALERLKGNATIAALLGAQRLRILAFGTGHEALRSTGLPVQDLGIVRHDARLALIYSAADLLVLPSREDNLPNVLLEAMACATPVVAFAAGGASEVIDDHRDGLLIPPLDTGAMAAAVAFLLGNDSTALAMGTAARQKMLAHYPLGVQAAAYETVFLEQTALSRQSAGCIPNEARPTPTMAALPVTLHPNIPAMPLAFFLEQQSGIEALQARTEQAQYELQRVVDVLANALAESRASTLWRATRPLRGFEPEAEISTLSSPETIAVALLTLMRSKSWEMTGLIRIAVRSLRGGLRLLKTALTRVPPHASAKPETVGPDDSNPPMLLDSLPELAGKPLGPGNSPLNIICLHLFHLDLWDEFRNALRPIIGPDTPLYLSLPEDQAHFVSVIRQDFSTQECTTFLVENRGQDVLPFLQQFRFLLENGLRPVTLTKLHSKKSAHVAHDAGDNWRKDLYEGLLAHHASIVDQFSKNPALGLACSRQWWVEERPESLNFQAESRVIAEACELFDLRSSSHYLSGNMYTVSFEYLERLFADVDLDAYFSSFPAGYRPSDTPGHAFERMVCYGLQKHGYRVGVL